MERLVDADKIRYSDLSDGLVPEGVWCTWKDRIDDMPTVEAIPIEWIKSWAMKNWVKSKKCEFDIIASKLIDDWMEKENGKAD